MVPQRGGMEKQGWVRKDHLADLVSSVCCSERVGFRWAQWEVGPGETRSVPLLDVRD